MPWLSPNLIVPITNLCIFGISLTAWLRNPRSRAARTFFFASLVFGFWNTANFYSLQPGNLAVARLATHLSYVGGLWLLIALAIFSLYFPFERKFSLTQTLFLIAATIGGGWLSYSNLVAKQIDYRGGQFVITPGSGYILFGLLALYFLGLVLWTFYHNYQVADVAERNQIRYIAFGIVITFATGIILNFVLVLINPIFGSPLIDSPAALLAEAFMGYGLIRHRYLDIHVVISHLVTYLVCFGLFALILIGSAWEFARQYPHSITALAYGLSTVAFILLIALQPLMRRVQRWAAQIFDPAWYDSATLLNELGTQIASELNLESLIASTLTALTGELRASFGQIILNRADGLTDSAGSVPFSHITKAELEGLALTKTMLIVDELPTTDLVRQTLEKYGVKLVINLKTRGQFVGYLVLGVKLTGDIYSAQDIGVLKVLSNQLAVAIVGAEAFAEISKFNDTLQDRINHATASLRKAHDKLRQDDDMKTEFIALTSHNLRTPLTIIRGQAELLELSKLSNEQLGMVKSLQSGTDRLNELVEELLLISSIESGNQLALQEVLASDVLEPLVSEAQKTAVVRAVKLVLDIKVGNVIISGNLPRLQKAISNIIDNAFKFTDHGQVSIAATVSDNKLKLIISDTGRGIEAAEIPKLFNTFHRATDFMNYDYEGEGIGLFLANLIIKEHHGKIEVKSQPGHGSSFTVTLPLKH